jgi:hypothetical protein
LLERHRRNAGFPPDRVTPVVLLDIDTLGV